MNLSDKIFYVRALFNQGRLDIEDVQEFIKKLKETGEDFELRVYGIVMAETGLENTIKCLREAFGKRNKEIDKEAGAKLI